MRTSFSRSKNGKIVEATANDNDRINQLLDTDEGARYFGEFAIGVNPYVLEPMKDTLFDEKIRGQLPPDAGSRLRRRYLTATNRQCTGIWS